MLHDAHNHLQDEWLAPHLDRIARAATDAHIADMVVNGTHPDDWPRVAELAARFPFVCPAYGIHPWDAGRPLPDDWLIQLETLLLADPRASIGEIGIDRWILNSARPDDPRLAGVRRASLDEQTAVFLPQLALAAKLNRPVTIHCLQAWGALDKLLHSHPVPARGFLIHAYSGPAELVPPLAALGAYFSFNGYFLDPRKTKQQDVFKLIPANLLLVETDSPAMSLPQSWRTHKLPPAPDGTPVNHPGNLDAAYAALASLRGVPLSDLTTQVTTNFTRLFAP
ncbi:MAG: TatD family hydrolase [Opitutaceae bacterium]|nr:TatD family hydrolase [Opitutaceae bacterium]